MNKPIFLAILKVEIKARISAHRYKDWFDYLLFPVNIVSAVGIQIIKNEDLLSINRCAGWMKHLLVTFN